MSVRISPNRREALSAISTVNNQQEYLSSTNGILNVNATITSDTSNTQYAEGIATSPGTGTLALGRYLSAEPTLTTNQLYGLRLDVNQRLMVNPAALTAASDTITSYQGGSWAVSATQSGTWKQNPGTTATVALTSVASANTTITLAASNTSRSGFYLYNDSTAVLYLAYASTASTTAYTVQIQAGGWFEMPSIPVYTGILSGIWASANGNARITETS